MLHTMEPRNKLNQILLWLLLILLFPSCEEILNIKVPEHSPLITVNCILDKDEPIQMEINSSQPYPPLFDTSLTIKDATVKLFEDNIFVEDLVYQESYQLRNAYSNYYSLNGFKPLSNHSYSIIVTAPGFTEATAKTNFPEAVPVLSIDTSTVLTKYSNYSIKALECIIKFQDPSGKKNYYKLGIKRSGKFTECDFQGLNCKTQIFKKTVPCFCYDLNAVYFRKSPNIPGSIPLEKEDNEYWINEVFLSDASFDGLTYELKVLIPLPLVDLDIIPGDIKGNYSSKIYFNLYSINEEYFLYARSYFTQVYKKNDMFSEPSLVYNNIEKGLGIFSGTSISVDSSIVVTVHSGVIFN
jgi:hypothetical protein